MTGPAKSFPIASAKALYVDFAKACGLLAAPALLLARLVLAFPFWNSGLGKVNTVTLFERGGFRFRLPTPSIEDATFQLFAYEFFEGLPRVLTDLLAVLSAVGELTLPVLVALGLLTRFAALGVLTMALVIQLFVYPEEWWAVHSWWVAVSLLIVAHGGGGWSLDRRLGLEPR